MLNARNLKLKQSQVSAIEESNLVKSIDTQAVCNTKRHTRYVRVYNPHVGEFQFESRINSVCRTIEYCTTAATQNRLHRGGKLTTFVGVTHTVRDVIVFVFSAIIHD